MIKVGVESSVVEDKDDITIQLGNDFSYSDIKEKVLIEQPTTFAGKTYIDTGIKLFDEDRDFVLAIDYKFASDITANAVIAQCFASNGTNGFRIWNSSGSKIAWGTSSTDGVSLGTRDMVVIRHIKGDNGLYVYSSNVYGSELKYVVIPRTRTTATDATLVFGCAKADDGAYENYASGTVYWSKIWYADLGDSACRKLAAWTHESMTFEACGFKRFYLSDNSNKRCSLVFLQKSTIGPKMALSGAMSNEGGWPATTLTTYLDSRLLNALPIGWQQLIKQVKVSSSAGKRSKEIVTANNYFFIPSIAELVPSMTDEPYIYEGSPISYMTDNTSRLCTDPDGNETDYWTRSPFIGYDTYFYLITEEGEPYSWYYPSEQHGVRTMFCI